MIKSAETQRYFYVFIWDSDTFYLSIFVWREEEMRRHPSRIQSFSDTR